MKLGKGFGTCYVNTHTKTPKHTHIQYIHSKSSQQSEIYLIGNELFLVEKFGTAPKQKLIF